VDIKYANPSSLDNAPLDDPLFQAMAPLPSNGEGVWVFHDPEDRLLRIAQILCRLSGMEPSLVLPIWYYNTQAIIDRLKLSNISPFAMTDATSKDATLLFNSGRFARAGTRRIVVLSKDRFPGFNGAKWHNTKLDETVADLPLEVIGATLLQKHMTKSELPF